MPRLYEDNNPIIVKYVRKALDLKGIDLVWQYLGKKFGFNIKAWSKEFQNYLNPNDRDKSYQTQFMEFGKKRIEPLLNAILCRERYPTWIYMLAYLFRDKIDAFKKEIETYRNWRL